ncbi:hypothetical protein ACU686_32490 [Yinghuangia aomiensis]
MLSPETLAAAIDDDGDAIDDIAALAADAPHEVAPHLPAAARRRRPPGRRRSTGRSTEDSQRALVARIEAGTDPTAAQYLDIARVRTQGRYRTRLPALAGRAPGGCAAAAVEQSTIDAGWLVTGDGIRELQAAVSYALVPGDGARRPVDDDAHCPWCAAPLWVALDVGAAQTDDPGRRRLGGAAGRGGCG